MAAGSRPWSAAVWRAMSISSASSAGEPLPGKKPSPRRPARSAAAREWPPTTIGIGALGGLGFDDTRWNEANSPSKLAPSLAHRARMAPTYSSVRAPRRAHGHAEGVELLLQPADADAELDPPARQVVEGGQLLGQHDRVALREDEDAGGEAERRRDRGDVGQPDQRVRDGRRRHRRHLPVGAVRVGGRVVVGVDDVLDGPDRLEAGGLGALAASTAPGPFAHDIVLANMIPKRMARHATPAEP